ncbi:DUF4221 family protein [Cecembia sp.]|uniref:DUF4221 family protein n=1 Tax=Cecembia sp. TaxID=1898110 RepID=UPI0025BEF089|nr:DUF4221 family protein [Cecembia sp.]
MKKHYLIILAFIAWSCGKSLDLDVKNQGAQLSIEQDTVQIDAKGEILMAAVNMYVFDLSPDKNLLYSFNRKTYSLEILDLVHKKLVEQRKFAKDGPDAVSSFPQRLISLGNDQIMIMGFEKSGIYTLEGEFLKEIALSPTMYEQPEEIKDFGFRNDIIFLNDSTVLTGIMSFQDIYPYLVKLHLNQKELSLIKFEPIKELEKFKIEVERPKIIYTGNFNLVKFGDKILISSNFFNDAYILNPENGEYTHLTFTSELTPNAKTTGHKPLVSTPDELSEEMKKLSQQIEFGKWLWDEKEKLFYRLSFYKLPDQEIEELANVYLTVFDQELNMLVEKKISGYQKVPGTYFVKDGAIWIHENIEDELAFVRLKISLSP